VTSVNLLAEVNGNVVLETNWESAESRWRTLAVRDRYAYAINGNVTVEELEFKASNLSLLFTGVATGSMPLYGMSAAETNATALYWQITTTTAPKPRQFCFEFTRTDDGKKFQFYAPRAEIENWPTPFNVDNFTMQNVTFNLLASTSGEWAKYLNALA
jgi:hypothetical protein